VDASHAADLELACRCAAGEPAAWDRFVLEYRPVLYRAADALDRSGGARELADSLYAELYGLKEAGRERQSLFRYFSGKSSLATWLRAVLAQRYVDRLRTQRRLEPLPPEDRAEVLPSRASGRPEHVEGRAPADPERGRHLDLMQEALGRAVARLAAKDRLRLACYYVQELTLAETGRLLGEHEATVSRQLARARRAIREAVERELRDQHGLTEVQVEECVASVADDPGPLDLRPLLGSNPHEREASERSL
jgi:RNA polymerase sigma-70 factor (ECF subfamily)